MTNHSKNTIWLLTIGAFFAFFVFGFTDNLKGPALPAILQDMKFSYSQGGSILLGIYLGFIAATITSGPLADAVGQKFVLVLAAICLSIGLSSFGAFSSPALMTTSMAILGFGLGSLELGCNSLIVELHSSDKGRYLNLMAVMHGLGSMLAPLYAGWLLSGNSNWRSIYQWDLIPVGLLVLYFSLTSFPKNKKINSEKVNFRLISKTAFTPEMLWYYATITLYVTIELGIASWLVEFLQKERQFSVAQSNQALSAFFGLIMIGRFVGSFFIERLGYLKSILVNMLAASFCIALGLFGPPQLSFLLPGSGFFLSIIFPTITAAVSDTHKENINTILGILFTFAGFGGVIGPWLVGFASDLGGIKFGFSVNLFFGLLTACTAYILLKLKKNKLNPSINPSNPII
jgi:FHS family glucose/mannose:H+ symporter-like MFS transporter